jgi:hypothetical protein
MHVPTVRAATARSPANTQWPEEAKAVLVYLGRRYPFEVTQAMDAVTGKWRP